MTFQEAIPKFLNYIRVVRTEGTYHYNRQDIFKAYRAYEKDLKNASNFT